MKRRYPTLNRYDQTEFNPTTGMYRNLDPASCVGCATANAAQGLLASQGFNAIGDYGFGIYERAKRKQEDEFDYGLQLTFGVEEALDTFNEGVLDNSDYTMVSRDVNPVHVRDFLLNHGPLVIGVNWLEGMMYPTPQIPDNAPWFKRLWYHLRSPRFAKAEGANTGYHCVALMGIDDSKDAYVIENSYGTKWANRGNVYISRDDLDKVLIQAVGFTLEYSGK